MTSQIYQADDGQLVQEHDQLVPETTMTEPDADLAEPDADLAEPDADLAEPKADLAEPDADHESAASAYGNPGSARDGDHAAEEPGVADTGPASPSPVSASFTVPESVTSSRIPDDTASVGGPWNEVQAMFVDDPRASIERAAGLADERVEALIQSVRERQRSLQSAWWADDAGTEELRLALQHYRTFWNSLEGLPG